MSTKHLSGCITLHGVKTHNKLPEDVKIAVADGNTALAIKNMEAYLDNLKATRQQIIKNHTDNKSEFMAQTISSTSAASYVNRASTDPTNELNDFKVKSFSKIWKNTVQLLGSVKAAVEHLVSKDKVTAGEREVMEHFMGPDGFNRKMDLTINSIFLAKEGNKFPFRYEDMIQYLPVRLPSEFEKANLKLDDKHAEDNGILDAVTRGAIAATAYEWLATNGRKSAKQSEESLRQLLGLKKDEPLPANSFELLEDVGTDAETLARQLGRTILQRISIVAGPQADSQAQGRMEESLGFMAIAAMEAMGIMDRQVVIADRTEDAKAAMTAQQLADNPLGLEGLKDHNRLKPEQVFYQDTGKENGKKGLLTLTMVRVMDVAALEEFEKTFAKGRSAFDKLFANEEQSFGMQWVAKAKKSFRIGDSNVLANTQQTKNINKYNSIPYQRNPEAIGFLKSMWGLIDQREGADKEALKSIFYELLGAPSADNSLEVHDRNNVGIRRGIEQDFTAVLQYEDAHADRVKKGESTEFFLSSDFMSNMRMLMRGEINPQNSKMHRSLFAPTGFQTTFTKNPKGELDQAFLEAIAVAFDIETGKGIIGDAAAQIAKLKDKLTNPEIQNAIQAIQEYQRTKIMTVEAMSVIAAGSTAVGNKVTGLKGLFEYARYDAIPNGQEFTTDMHAEIDGVSNGVIIGILQLLPDGDAKQMRNVLATLAMGGISTSAAKANLNKLLIKNNLNDAYQRMAQEWALEIAKLKKEWDQSDSKYDGAKYDKAAALGKILGEFQDKNGVINKIIRSLSKPRTMQIIYGAGTPRQIKLMAAESVLHDGIYKQVEDIIGRVIAATDATGAAAIKADFAQLMEHVSTITGDKTNFKTEKYFTGKKKETIANLRKFHLGKGHIANLNKAVEETYGLAMSNAIQKVYGPLIAARKPLNASVQLAVTTYNTVLRRKVELLVAEHKANIEFKGDPEIITNEELDKILASIEHLIPKVRTPLHTNSSPSYLPMAEVGKNRSYTKKSKVVQKYRLDSLPSHQGYAEGIPYLEDPGVAPIIKTIHMLDSMVANGLMGLDTHMLNNHDGFSHGIGDSKTIATAANSIFAKTMTEYSLAQAFLEMHDDLATEGERMMKELDLNPEDFFYGVAGNKDNPLAYTGGLMNDKVVSFDLLVDMGIASKEDRKEFTGELTADGVPYDKAAKEYLSDVITRHLKATGKDLGTFVNEVVGQVTKNISDIETQTTRNKKEITDSVYQWMQYPHHGEGIEVTPTNKDNPLFGSIDPHTILHHDAYATNKNIETLKKLVDAGYGSSAAGVSTDVNDYPASQIVDGKNATEVFDSLLTMNNNLEYASVQNSPGHVEYLKTVLNSIVSKVMGPVEMFIGQHKINNETQGMWTVGSQGKQIWIQTQQRSDHPLAGMLGQSIRMSAGEIYVHELVHHITHTGLKNFPHLQQQASALRELAFQEFTNKYNDTAYRVFLNDPTIDVTDQANIYEVTAAIDRWNYVFNPPKKADRSNPGLDEFISFGMTNENFKRELSKLQVSPEILKTRKTLSTIFEKNIQQTIVNIFSMVLDFIYHRFNGQRHSSQVDQELENLVRAISYTDSKNKGVIWKFAADTEGALTALSLKMDDKIVGAVKGAINKTKISQAITQLKKLPDLDNMLSHQVRIMLHWYTNQQQGLIPSLITEMKGTTDRLRPLHDMLRMRNYVIDVAKNEATAVMRAVNNEWFKDELNSTEKTSITKALLKTDIGSLLTYGLSDKAIIGYVSDANQREDRIAEILREIRSDAALKDYATFFENAADDLGYFMVHSAAKTKDSVPFMNAHNIVAMKQSKHAGKITGEAFTRAVGLVDQLATLASLRYVSKAYKNSAAALMNKDWSAIENVLNHHNILKDNALKDLFHGNPVLMTKGYVKQILNSRIKFEQGTLADRKKFEDAGYYMQETPIPRDPNDPVQEPIYMFRSMLGAVNDLQPGIMSYTQNVARGTMSYDIQHQLSNTLDPAMVADRNNRIVLNNTLDKIDRMFNTRTSSNQAPPSNMNHMLPKFDYKGDITEMRYMMSEATKDAVLEQFSEFDAILGAMTGQIVDKVATPRINSDVVLALKAMADKERKKYPEAYVEISPWSKEQRYRDIYHQLPPKTRANILSEWGENRMWVAQDVVDLAFGQRKYSISETFNKDPKERNLFEKMFVGTLTLALGGHNPLSSPPPGAVDNNSAQGRSVRRATAVYNTLAQLTKLGKSNIVVRNLGVVWGNHNSNMMFLKSMGIPLEKILLYNKEATLGILQYQKDKYELESWLHKRDIIQRKQSLAANDRDTQIRNISRRIDELDNRIALNKVTPFIKSGAMPSIVDDVDTGHIQSPYAYGVDAVLDKAIDVLPQGLQKAGRTLFMTTDTEGFKMLNNAVKLTDFTGRYILYNHLMSKGMDHDSAVSTVMDKFINFDLPTHRMVSMLNDIGLVMFSKYQLRVLKHIKDVVLEHPFTALATYLVGTQLGNNNILNSVPFVTKDAMQNIGNAVSLATSTPWDTAVIDGVQFVGGIAADVVIPGK